MALLKFTRDTAEKICGHHMDMTNMTFMSRFEFDLDRYQIYFPCAKIRIIIRGLLNNENTGI